MSASSWLNTSSLGLSFAEAECTKDFRQLQLVVLVPRDGVSTGQRGVDGQVIVTGRQPSTLHTLMVLRRNVVLLVEYFLSSCQRVRTVWT